MPFPKRTRDKGTARHEGHREQYLVLAGVQKGCIETGLARGGS